MEFGCCLVQPERGGKKHNFTKKVLMQIDTLEVADSTHAPSDTGHQKHVRSGAFLTEETRDTQAAKRASMKLDAGDIRGAVKALCSNEVLSVPSPATTQLLKDKHPPAPADKRAHPCLSAAPLNVYPSDVFRAIKSFTPGSAAGPDGVRPQHLLDMTDKRTNGTLIDAITDLVNLILAGGVPDLVRAEFCWASLLAFSKKGGGIRPIAVGYTLRRLVSKVANFHAVQICSPILAPRQLGVGINGGAEALAHAARRFLAGMSNG